MKAKRFETIEEFDWQKGSYFTSIAAGEKEPCIFAVLPCGHHVRTAGWQHELIEDETRITLSPSIFCRHSDNPRELGNCWHGYLRNGEFISV